MDFDPSDTSGLSAAFRRKPVAAGVLAVFGGGRRPDRGFAAWLMAGELGLPLVHSSVPVAGCAALVEWQASSLGAGPASLATSVAALTGISGAAGVAVTAGTAPGIAGTATALPSAPPGSVVILSVGDRVPDAGSPADLVVRFSATGRPPLLPPPVAVNPGPEDRIDPCCHFSVEINGREYGFSEVAALSCQSSGSRGTVYPDIVLRRAITLDKSLYEWRMNLVRGQADVRPLTISHLSAAGKVVRTWWIEGAWPVRWSGPSLDAMASRPAFEEIEIAVSRFDWR
jgi:phage tail-like protein